MSSTPSLFSTFNQIKECWSSWLERWPDGLIALDNDGKIVWLSDKAISITGWTLEQVVGKEVHDLLCLENREFEHARPVCPLTKGATGDEPVMNSANWLSASGDYISVDFRVLVFDASDSANRLISFFETRHKAHNFADLEKFAGFVDKNPAAIAEFDFEGQMLFGNPAMQEILLLHGFDEQGVAAIFPDKIADICRVCCNESQNQTNINVKVDDRWYSWHFHPLQSDDEMTAIGYAFDSTEQRIAEEQARTTRAQARRDFYAKMMHELRTPLNAIVGYSDLVLCRSEENFNDQDKRALEGIKSGGMQLNELISDTLDISKIEAGRMTVDVEVFSVLAVVDDLQEQMQYLATVKKLDYEVNCDANIMVRTDRKKVRQILVNLVSNAIKYTKKGSISLVVMPTSGNQFMLRVVDTGVGIPEAQLKHLFVAYTQVRERQNLGIQGTGLGLALVNELVSILGGKIDVESVYGEGSAFTVLLPMMHAEQK